MLKIKIHRGSNQIGGCATEIECNGERVIIDLGANLPGTDEEEGMSDAKLLDSVFGEDRARHIDAILFSHYHRDHYGLYKDIHDKNIPLYIGETAKEMLKIITSYTDRNAQMKGNPIVESMKVYQAGKPIEEIKNMKITPYTADHSALDAYMFLIEADGKKILFTGDFRDHGIASERGLFEKIIEKHIGTVDFLLTEGTMLSRTDEASHNIVRTEDELGKKAGEYFALKKYNFVLVSSTNLDSIMEFYHNTPKDKLFICDTYQAKLIMCAVKNKHKYYSKYQGKREDRYLTKHMTLYGDTSSDRYFKNYRLLNYLAEQIKNDGKGGRYPSIYWDKLDVGDDIASKGFVMLVRPNRFCEINGPSAFEKAIEYIRKNHKDDMNFIYSMWKGYLTGDKKDEDILSLVGNPEELIQLHTSGHAYVETIAKLMDMVKPKVIIPMHTEMADYFADFEEFKDWKSNIKRLEDGKEAILG